MLNQPGFSGPGASKSAFLWLLTFFLLGVAFVEGLHSGVVNLELGGGCGCPILTRQVHTGT